jgi:hypothetical protein
MRLELRARRPRRSRAVDKGLIAGSYSYSRALRLRLRLHAQRDDDEVHGKDCGCEHRCCADACRAPTSDCGKSGQSLCNARKAHE